MVWMLLFCPSVVSSSCVLLSSVLSGLGDSLWQLLVPSWACLMIHRDVVLPFVWSGLGSGCLGGLVSQQLLSTCRFCGGANGGHLLWECRYPLLVEIRENPEFHDLMKMEKSHWPWCLLSHGWQLLLSGTNGNSPWDVTAAEGALFFFLRLLRCLLFASVACLGVVC